MKKIIFISIFALIAVCIIVFKFPSYINNFYTLGNYSITFPKSIAVNQRDFSQEKYAPNGYCGDSNTNSACKLLTIGTDADNFVLSTPKQFGYLTSDSVGCFKETSEVIAFNGISIKVSKFYQNKEQTTYNPDQVDLSNNPYNCDKVETNEINYHHLSGCENGICVWSQGIQSYNYLKQVSSKIKIINK